MPFRQNQNKPENKSGNRSRIRRLFQESFRRNKKVSAEDEPHFDTIGGVYATEALCSNATKRQESFSSLESETTQSSTDSCWSSSGSADHHAGAPLLVRSAVSQRRINPDNIQLSDEELLGRIMLRSRKLPKNHGYFASNHVMINNERTKRFISPLRRMPAIDELAREQAKVMAAENQLQHQDPTELAERLGQHSGCRIGENATRGSNLEAIHQAMMGLAADRNNIIDHRFAYMGVGTAKAEDGTLYLCQIFRDEMIDASIFATKSFKT